VYTCTCKTLELPLEKYHYYYYNNSYFFYFDLLSLLSYSVTGNVSKGILQVTSNVFKHSSHMCLFLHGIIVSTYRKLYGIRH